MMDDLPSADTGQPIEPRCPGFDPFSSALRDDPFPLVADAHARAPVFFEPNLGAWALTKFDDVAEAMRDSDTFSSKNINGLIPTPAELRNDIPDLRSDQFTIIMGMDPPDHGVLRMPMQRALSRKLVEGIASTARRVAEELVDALIDRGECDLMNDFAYPFSGRAIAAVLGVPGENVEDYRRWFDHMGGLFVARPLHRSGEAGNLGHDFSAEQISTMWKKVAEANRFFRHFVLDHVENPRDDIISAMMVMKNPDGSQAYDSGEIVRAIFTLLGGGQDTTANLIANIAMLLTQNPDQQELLTRDMQLLPNAVEEGCRRKGAAVGLVRVTTRAVQVRGVTIPAGSLVYLSLHGANMDPDKFADPGRFDIHRPNASKHLAFGVGRHACVGQPLARLETEIALDVLYRRMPKLRIDLTQERVYKPNFTASVLTGLRASW